MSFLSTLAQTTSEFNFESFDPSSFDTSTLESATTTVTTSTDTAALAGVGIVLFLVWFLFIAVFAAIMIASMWKIFKKAGKEGWAAIIPIYNTVVMLQIVGRPVWWIFLFLVPVVNFVVGIIVAIDLAKSFGKDAGLGIVMALFPIIGYPILGFGDSKYVGPVAAEGSTPAAPAQPAA